MRWQKGKFPSDRYSRTICKSIHVFGNLYFYYYFLFVLLYNKKYNRIKSKLDDC